MRTAGVLGGMGPAATLDFLEKVLAADDTPREQDKIRLIVDCNPGVLDRNAALRGEGASPGPDLAAMARGLVAAGADFLVIACNTAHAWSADIAAAVEAPLLSMIETACDEVAARFPHARRVGIMAGQGCLDAGLYQRACAERGWQAILADAGPQAALMDALYRLKAGAAGEAERAAFAACAQNLVDQGAEVVIAGCTEIPLLLAVADFAVPVVDSNDVLARRTVAYARGG
jgi:aspartate racemase